MLPILLKMPTILGIGIEVYVIVLILAIPFFFFWRRVLRRRIRNNAIVVLLSWVAAFGTAPILYTGLIVVWFAIANYYPTKDFDANKWAADKEKRYKLSENIIESHILIGKTKSEIKQLLGEENNDAQSDYWCYYLGYRPAIFGIDPDVLDIYFEKDRVVKVEQHQT